jgi:nucleoside-triphosphatase
VTIPPRLLLTGVPGIGKTTVVVGVLTRLRAADVPAVGFLTRELRECDHRVGFEVAALDGPSAVLAHVGWSDGPRVGRYRVDVEAFERVALPALEQARDAGAVIVVDELGRMELASAAFVAALDELFALTSPVLATVHQAQHPVTDRLEQRADVELIEVNAANREALPSRLSARLMFAWQACQGDLT